MKEKGRIELARDDGDVRNATVILDSSPQLVLASASPRRHQLLSELGVLFDICVADVIELNATQVPDPREMVLQNAGLKADWVAEKYPKSFVLGADTTVFLDETILNKPVDMKEAREMLRFLSGRTHTVFTGISFLNRELGLSETLKVNSEVTFKLLDEDMITHYHSIIDPLDKAGGYAIQDGGEMIVESYEGSLSNIIGLPIEETKEILVRHHLL
ncbi:MAG: septum formation protein Maf [Opitutaceae bacterium]|nr:septum formation protein Maf [Opitutaceae bacterium]